MGPISHANTLNFCLIANMMLKFNLSGVVLYIYANTLNFHDCLIANMMLKFNLSGVVLGDKLKP